MLSAHRQDTSLLLDSKMQICFLSPYPRRRSLDKSSPPTAGPPPTQEPPTSEIPGQGWLVQGFGCFRLVMFRPSLLGRLGCSCEVLSSRNSPTFVYQGEIPLSSSRARASREFGCIVARGGPDSISRWLDVVLSDHPIVALIISSVPRRWCCCRFLVSGVNQC